MRNQHELHDVESHCSEEQPPACSAGCPLGVDVRSFLLAMRDKKNGKAWKILEKSLPLPGIAIHLCEAPCQQYCIRKDFGGAVAISALENVCLREAEKQTRIRPLPARGKMVRCIGSGASSLVCAWELAKKGYAVEVISIDEIGGQLRQCSLPEGTLAKEIEKLTLLKVQFRRASSEEIDFSLEGIDALFIGQDDSDCEQIAAIRPSLECDPQTMQTENPAIFTGGAVAQNPIVTALSDGRQAAISIDRFLQNASLLSGRVPLRYGKTTLVPDIADVQPMAQIQPKESNRFSNDEAAAEAARCIDCHCLRCVKACVYLQQYGDYPRVHARNIFNNFSIYQGVHGAYSLINSCSLCRQCEEVCPTRFSMADICLDARRRMVANDDMPPSAHYFALQEMNHAQVETNLLRPAPNQTESKMVFYPGCQLAAIRPNQVITLYQYLLELESKTALWLDCCGMPSYWGGYAHKQQEIEERFLQQWLDMGKPKIITVCSSCLQRFRTMAEEGKIDMESLISVWTLLAQYPPESRAAVDTALAISDPCTARYDDETREAVRSLLAGMEQQQSPLEASQELTECCGFGGLMENANPKIADAVVHARVQQSMQPFLTYCAMCRDRLAKSGRAEGGVYHLLDLLFPEVAESPQSPAVTLSERRHNRKMLKNHFLQMYGEKTMAAEAWSHIQIEVDTEIRQQLDSRRILDDDIRRTLAEQEEKGNVFVNTDGRRRVSARHGDVTFWVEFTRQDNVYHILRAWSHRMTISIDQ